MLFFLRTLVYKVYYGVIICALSGAYRYYWKKALHYKKKRDLNRLAYYFRHSYMIKQKIELVQLKKYWRINDYETLS